MRRRDFFKTMGATGAIAMVPRLAFGADIKFKMHDKKGQQVLLDSLNNPNYWNGVDVERPTDQLWDEFKLKKLDSGYLTFVSGHGNQNYTKEQVVQTVLYNQNHLPKHMAGAKKMTYFAEGVDPHFGVPFTDMVFLGDMDFSTANIFSECLDDIDETLTICAFERATKTLVKPERWTAYEKARKESIEGSDLRWPILNDIVPVTDVFGMYIVGPDNN